MTELENLSKIKIISKVNLLKDELDELRPLPNEQVQRIFQKFRLDWNFHSTAIEGNSLNYGETIAFLMHGVTAKGKPLKDHLDIKGHNQAIDLIMDMIKHSENFTEKDLRALHELILVEPYEVDAITENGMPTKKLIQIGRYKSSPNHVKTQTGEIHYYATPEETPILMRELMAWLKENFDKPEIHPVVLAAVFHHKFVSIHPFDDGNGRMARLMMNYILMQKEFAPIIIKNENRNFYYSVLSQADSGNPLPFIEFLAENMIHSFNIYIKGAKGESLAEPDDFEKEIALFKMQMDGEPNKIELIKSPQNITNICELSIFPFLECLDNKVNSLKQLYFNYSIDIIDIDKEQKWRNRNNSKINTPRYLIKEYKTVIEESDYNWIIFVFQFGDFKNGNNSFGIELKIRVKFEKLNYNISYHISNINELLGKNASDFLPVNNKSLANYYYHQDLSKDEIIEFSQTIASDLLSFTKQIYQNPDFFTLHFSNEVLGGLLVKYQIPKEFPNLSRVFNNAYLSYDSRVFTLDTHYYSEIKNNIALKADLLKFLIKELHIKFNVGLIIEESLPF